MTNYHNYLRLKKFKLTAVETNGNCKSVLWTLAVIAIRDVFENLKVNIIIMR